MYEIRIASESIVTDGIIELKKKKMIPESSVLNKTETIFKDGKFLCKLQFTDQCNFNPLLLPTIKKALNDNGIVLSKEDYVMFKKIDGHYKLFIPAKRQIIEEKVRKFPVDGLDSKGFDHGLTKDYMQKMTQTNQVNFNPILNLPSVKNTLLYYHSITDTTIRDEDSVELQQNNNRWELVITTSRKEIDVAPKEICVDGVEEELRNPEILRELLEDSSCKRETVESYQELMEKGYDINPYVKPHSLYAIYSYNVVLLIRNQLEVTIDADEKIIKNTYAKNDVISLEYCEKNGISYQCIQDNDAISFQINLTENQVKMLDLLKEFYDLCHPTYGIPKYKLGMQFTVHDENLKSIVDEKINKLQKLAAQHFDEFNALRKVVAPYFNKFVNEVNNEFWLMPRIPPYQMLISPPVTYKKNESKSNNGVYKSYTDFQYESSNNMKFQ